MVSLVPEPTMLPLITPPVMLSWSAWLESLIAPAMVPACWSMVIAMGAALTSIAAAAPPMLPVLTMAPEKFDTKKEPKKPPPIRKPVPSADEMVPPLLIPPAKVAALNTLMAAWLPVALTNPVPLLTMPPANVLTVMSMPIFVAEIVPLLVMPPWKVWIALRKMPVPTKPAALMLPLLTMPPPALALPKTLTVETRMPFCSDVIAPAFVIAPAKMPTLLTKMAWLLAEEMLPDAALTIEPVKVAGPSTPMPEVLAETVPLLVIPPVKVEIPTITVLLPTETCEPT